MLLHRLLERSKQQPSFRPVSTLALYVGRICAEFPALKPSEVFSERARLPEGFLEEIIETRHYVRAMQANEVDPKGWASSPMRTMAAEIEMALAEEEINGR